MPDFEVLERICARRAELDELEGRLVAQLGEVRAERDELAVAEKVLSRFADQDAGNQADEPAPVPVQVGGRAVLLIPHRVAGTTDVALPPEYQKILAFVRGAIGPVAAKQVGEGLGMDLHARSKLEPLRAKLVKLADRGWIRKLPDGRFTKQA